MESAVRWSTNAMANNPALQVKPSFSTADGSGRWMIGVQLERPIVITQLSFGEAFRESVDQNIKSAALIYQFLQGLIERRMSAKSIEGPIGIARLSGDAAREGPTAFVGLMAMVSLNLAVFNLLPIPILDGGLILLLADRDGDASRHEYAGQGSRF